jgi:hypothetical protein
MVKSSVRFPFVAGDDSPEIAGKSGLLAGERSRPHNGLRWFARILAGTVLVVAACHSSSAQGFGNGKRTVVLQRKLPAAVHLPGEAVDVRVISRSQENADLAQVLGDQLLVELQKNDAKMHLERNTPDAQIACVIAAYQTPPPATFTRQEVVFDKGKNIEQPVQYYKVTGLLTVLYHTRDSHGKTIDSDTVTANYSEDFEAATNQQAGESVGSKMVSPFKRMAGKKTDEQFGAPTPIELRQILLNRVVKQLASRVVNTNESVEVPVARGKLDSSWDLAKKGEWTRYLEALETMPPLPSPTDDAYRLYNIGVADEALAYQAEDKVSTQKLLDQAAINYGKAIDAKPSEHYFIDPQNRIETAVAHYRKLDAGANTANDSDTASTKSTAADDPLVAGGDASSPKPSAKTASTRTASTKAANSDPGTKTTPSAAKPAAKAAPKPTGPPLTNADVIKMAKAGVDEDSIIAAIHDAGSAQFDISPDGLIGLANNGVKGKIVAAMRQRAKQAQHSSPAGAN